MSQNGKGSRPRPVKGSRYRKNWEHIFRKSKKPVLTRCQADLDGECHHKLCPQMRDGEPEKSNRFCPLPPSGLTALRELGD